jgi:hypothetical protein
VAHEVSEQTAKQTLGLSDEDVGSAHGIGMAAQNRASGFTRGRLNDDLIDYGTGNGYTLTEQTRGARAMYIIIKWERGNIVKVIRK